MATAVTPTEGAFTYDPKGGTSRPLTLLPTRLTGDLAVAVTIGNGGIANERLDVRGIQTIGVLVETAATFLGTLSLDLHPLTQPATTDDTDGAARSTSNLPTTVTIAAVNTEGRITMDVSEYAFVELELTMSAGGTDSTNIGYVDIFWVSL